MNPEGHAEMDNTLKYIDEFREPTLARALLQQIHRDSEALMALRTRPLQIMEVCGGHTHSIFRFGLHELLPDAIELVHGPGCPVCVLPKGVIDDCLILANTPGVIFTSFGDALRVPGSQGSLLNARAKGADVRAVYSPADALAIARDNPEREVVFFGLGFETTLPATAVTLQEAKRDGINNFTVFCNHITIVATIKAILDSPGLRLDGFIGPGHASMIIGTQVFDFVPSRYRLPFVVTGFEPLDILQSVHMIVRQHLHGQARLENQYARVVRENGNTQALQAIGEVFTLRDFFEWRGLGSIDHSGLAIAEAYASFDAERRFALRKASIADPSACQCGEVLKGAIKPYDCKVFGKQCTPQQPMGALMVSSEGACAAYYQYGQHKKHKQVEHA
jgi:hydrogenase expression/formation protein HypD